jgi:hypothetical protein
MHVYLPRRIRWLALACAILLLAPDVASSQTTRAEVIAGQQAEKAGQLAEERPTQVEATVARVSAALMGGPPTGFYPWLGSVFDGAGAAAGAGYRRPFGGQVAITAIAGWSVRRSTLFELRADLPQLAGGRVSTAVLARRVEARRMAYYGLGPDTARSGRLRYDYQPASVGVDITARPAPFVVLASGYDRAAHDTRGTDFATIASEAAPAFGERLRYDVTRAGAALDWRPAPGYATRGGFVRAGWTRYHERRGRPFTFDTREVEAVQLVPLVQEHYVLAFRGLLTVATPREGHHVPFMLAPHLGSGSTLRGFRNRRFADDSRLLLTGEYRWRPSRYLDMALFVDAGQVAPGRDAFRRDAMRTSVGIGGRFHGPTFSALRLDVARGHEGWTLALSTSQPF